ncbi:class Ib ribonucleoside-diphosphate reductase assembly flavoprotein NrdI [Photobacterium carnosum]|uniref:class Ib ribonucleoside-diphosphate reductase assembly flavoprotein NrdI n=1 Tax=Photobacterium carnosum TaxID=2023717 RepID=UPI001C912444|nr:class Ib ribonucleoside-diphosphate reductase assembly flavoprotein NrdI [Photobacterium carnosum]MBY3790321.1 class Ib ribonucleoside-diphosphate reductase assembly flavoprotein NrdI [Photobacterium carnosum]MCD9496411.1 class Ib ribonucleoside-diphosphate reductase assembly flavoprotein NrdI [Photobacterium carnosum]MCD9535364.1 class Ib ribonucleoside-diphosphate reductase assembly flavoprotein NrdI [Photobacterium carnosum]
MLVYYSSASGNTQRFIEQLELPSLRLPIDPDEPIPQITQNFVLVCPTYADGQGRGAVPKSVIRALNQEQIRSLLMGVISSGNRNFGKLFAQSGTIISRKCSVPLLYRFELSGTPQDVQIVRQGLKKFWSHHEQSIHS